MHFVRIRVSVRLGLGLILHKTSTLNIYRNPQNVLFQVALGEIFLAEKNHIPTDRHIHLSTPVLI